MAAMDRKLFSKSLLCQAGPVSWDLALGCFSGWLFGFYLCSMAFMIRKLYM